MLEQVHYFDHEADIGIIGRGKTIEQAFVNAAVAVFAIMADLSLVKPVKSVIINFEESEIELALVTWLNLLIAEARINGLIFSNFKLTRNNSQWCGEAAGQPWSPEFIRGTEVKGATLTMLAVKQTAEGWEARCVVDV